MHFWKARHRRSWPAPTPILTVSDEVEAEQIDAPEGVARGARPGGRGGRAEGIASAPRAQAATSCRPSIACAKAGVTTGEWGEVFREVYGEYRAPTGVPRAARQVGGGELDPVRAEVERLSQRLGRRLKFLVGKPGLDGHSNGAEQIAVRARDAGMDVVYGGIRFTPAEIVKTAQEEGVHVIGLSILSGSHVSLVRDVVERMKQAGLRDIPVVVGGIVPPEDERILKKAGVAAVYTPKNFDMNRIMADVVRIVESATEKVT